MKEKYFQVGDLFLASKDMWLVISNKPHMVWWSFVRKTRVEQVGRPYPFSISFFSETVVRPSKLFRDGKLLKEFK